MLRLMQPPSMIVLGPSDEPLRLPHTRRVLRKWTWVATARWWRLRRLRHHSETEPKLRRIQPVLGPPTMLVT